MEIAMKRALVTLALAAAAPLGLAACADGYTRVGVGYGTAWHSYPYSVWYDNYYGPFYDGYWGTDGYFWFRLFSSDRTYRRADPRHVYRERPQYAERYRYYEGRSYQPPRGAHVPNYPSSPDRDRDRDRDHR